MISKDSTLLLTMPNFCVQLSTTLDSGEKGDRAEKDRIEDLCGMFANEGRFFKGSKGGAKSTRHILTKDPD